MQFTSVAIFFILTNDPGGYRPPQDITKDEMHCGIDGAVTGVQLDRAVNPTIVKWIDPISKDKHCEIDIRERVIGLPEGQYHIATTIMGDGSSLPMNYHDPHVSDYFNRVNGTGTKPTKPVGIGIKP